MALEFKDLIIGYKNSRKSQQIAGPFDLKIPEKKLTAVIGKNGAGKTTLTEMLSKHYRWIPQFEDVDHNPYLMDFYDDMTRWLVGRKEEVGT